MIESKEERTTKTWPLKREEVELKPRIPAKPQRCKSYVLNVYACSIKQ